MHAPPSSAGSDGEAPPPQQAAGSTTRVVAWNTSVQAGARLTAVALGLVTTALVTRYLGVEGFGDYVTVTIYVAVFAVVFDWGTSAVLVRELSARKEAAHHLISNALALRPLLAVGIGLVAAALLPLLYGGPDAARIRLGVLVLLPMLLFNAVATTVATFFHARLQMGRVAAAELLAQAAGTGLVVLLVVLDRGFYEIVATVAVASAVNAAVMIGFARGRVRLVPAFDLAAWRFLFLTALPLGIALVLNAVYFRIDAILLSILRDSQEVGVYGVAYRFLEVAVPFSHFLVLALFPLFSAAAHEGAWEALRRGAQRGFDVLLVVAVPFVLGTIALAPQLVPLLVGGGFEESVTALRIVIVGAGLLFVTWLLSFLLVAVGRQRDVLWLNAGVLAFNVALNLLLIPRYGYLAAASVATASEAAILVAAIWLVRRRIGFLPSLSVALRAGAAGAAMFALVIALDASIAVRAGAAVAAYAAVLALLRVPQALGLRELVSRSGR